MTVADLGYREVAESAKRALEAAFAGNDLLVETDPAPNGRVFVVIVSRLFNGMTPEEKQDSVWGILKRELGERCQQIALAVARGTDELM
jgi:hypothetical protein